MQARSMVFLCIPNAILLIPEDFVVIFIHYFLDLQFMQYITVSAKVKRELYEKIKKYNISVSKVIRRALEEEEIKRKLNEAQAILRKIPLDEIVNSIRESREKNDAF